MSNLFCWASINEKRKAVGGKVGNQTGTELKIGYLYDFGQNYCIRIYNSTVRKRGAKYAKALAKNLSIGYGQDIDNSNPYANRDGLYRLAKSCDWNYKQLVKKLKHTKVNTDCSAFASTIINLAFKRGLIPCSTTFSIYENVLCVSKQQEKSGKKVEIAVITYEKARKKFYLCDMPFRRNKHIIINI